VLTDATADMTLALILALMRRVVEGDRLLRRGGFKGWAPEFCLGHDLQGKVLGIYGFGRIGQAVARRALAFGMQVIYSTRTRRELFSDIPQARFVSFDELLASSDVLSIHVPLNPETQHRFDLATLRRMKPGSFIVNTARGQVIVEKDLVQVLREGHLAGAGLDVYEHEPAVEPGLSEMEQVVLLPHLGSATRETRDKMALMVAESVAAFVRGEDPPHRVPELRGTQSDSRSC
jgi:glyoxylate reductase